jgi:hypothetical protein
MRVLVKRGRRYDTEQFPNRSTKCCKKADLTENLYSGFVSSGQEELGLCHKMNITVLFFRYRIKTEWWC